MPNLARDGVFNGPRHHSFPIQLLLFGKFLSDERTFHGHSTETITPSIRNFFTYLQTFVDSAIDSNAGVYECVNEGDVLLEVPWAWDRMQSRRIKCGPGKLLTPRVCLRLFMLSAKKHSEKVLNKVLQDLLVAIFQIQCY